jgi:hypothetical protein
LEEEWGTGQAGQDQTILRADKNPEIKAVLAVQTRPRPAWRAISGGAKAMDAAKHPALLYVMA